LGDPPPAAASLKDPTIMAVSMLGPIVHPITGLAVPNKCERYPGHVPATLVVPTSTCAPLGVVAVKEFDMQALNAPSVGRQVAANDGLVLLANAAVVTL
jgi:hypothetical protein